MTYGPISYVWKYYNYYWALLLPPHYNILSCCPWHSNIHFLLTLFLSLSRCVRVNSKIDADSKSYVSCVLSHNNNIVMFCVFNRCQNDIKENHFNHFFVPFISHRLWNRRYRFFEEDVLPNWRHNSFKPLEKSHPRSFQILTTFSQN